MSKRKGMKESFVNIGSEQDPVVIPLYEGKSPRWKKHGFSLTLRNVKCTVFFRSFNKETHCFLITDDPLCRDSNRNAIVFEGIARKDPSDVYDRGAGELLSLSRVIDKFVRYVDHQIDLISVDYEKLFEEMSDKLISKLEKVSKE